MVRLLHLSCWLIVITLSGCGFQYHNLSQSQVQQSQTRIWGKPAIGRYLCLSVDPDVAVYSSINRSQVIGYTRNVVAFYGLQDGGMISVLYYNGALGWIDGLKIRPYHGPRPNSTCVIPGVDMQQRPIFIIR